jgi:hypothetical protein
VGPELPIKVEIGWSQGWLAMMQCQLLPAVEHSTCRTSYPVAANLHEPQQPFRFRAVRARARTFAEFAGKSGAKFPRGRFTEPCETDDTSTPLYRLRVHEIQTSPKYVVTTSIPSRIIPGQISQSSTVQPPLTTSNCQNVVEETLRKGHSLGHRRRRGPRVHHSHAQAGMSCRRLLQNTSHDADCVGSCTV